MSKYFTSTSQKQKWHCINIFKKESISEYVKMFTESDICSMEGINKGYGEEAEYLYCIGFDFKEPDV